MTPQPTTATVEPAATFAVLLAGLNGLQTLDVSSTAIGDAVLEAVKGLPALGSLWFNSMKGVTRKGMAAIAAMPALRMLVIQFAEINEEVDPRPLEGLAEQRGGCSIAATAPLAARSVRSSG